MDSQPLTAHQYLFLQHHGDALAKFMARAVRRIKADTGLNEASVVRLVIAAYEMAHFEQFKD